MGDKTQLLALVLVTRFKKPWTILAGILVATILNHAGATYFGRWISGLLDPQLLTWILAGTFFIFGLWILIPDKQEECPETHHWNVFFTTIGLFFMAEMGDKTQLATVALGARYDSLLWVTLGTTFGMMGSNAIAIFLGHKWLKKVPMKWVRVFTCALFLLTGLYLLLASGSFK